MNEPMAYIGRRSCDCVVFAAVDDPKHAKDTAKEVARCLRDGLQIERVTCEWVRSHKFGCEHQEKKKTKQGKLL